MSLHKELVAAFGLADQPDVGNIGEVSPSEHGYFWKKIDFALVVNSSGELLDIERPPWRFGGKRRRNSLLVPYKPYMGEGGASGFLWGQSPYALGLGKPGQGGPKANREPFNRFRTFHQAVLCDATDPSIRAFLLFLERWDPENMADVGKAAEVAGGALAFRFRYDDCFLHETHAARLSWARLLNPSGGATARTSSSPAQGPG